MASRPRYNVVMAPRLTNETKQYILKRHSEGAALRLIAREIGRPDVTVRRTLLAAGVELGPPRTSSVRSAPKTEALILRLYEEGATWREICEQAGVTSGTVSKVARRCGSRFSRRGASAQAKTEAILALHDAGHSARAIGRRLGHSKSTIRSILENNGATPLPPVCERDDYFVYIDTPEKAYWLGFISADGCMITTSRHPEGDFLSIHLAAVDRQHLVKLRETLGVRAGINSVTAESFGKVRSSVVLTVRSRLIRESLLALGVLPRKSDIIIPWAGPEHLMPHYWRGLLDGDGSLAHKTRDLYTVFCLGSEPCVRGFLAWAHEICGTQATPYFRTGCWYVSISGRHQIRKLVQALYGDAPVSLDRKQEIANRILGTE